jgi:hypothetical protein
MAPMHKYARANRSSARTRDSAVTADNARPPRCSRKFPTQYRILNPSLGCGPLEARRTACLLRTLHCWRSWRAAGVDDRIRQAARTIYQRLIEAELNSVIGVARANCDLPGPPR